ncbi:MAG: TldD/PmbA family protein, partial [Candidatus Hydrogenedentota bacterium]
MSTDVFELLERVVDSALALGAKDAEAVHVWEDELEIEVAGGEVETLASAEAVGVGVRVFTDDHRVGFAYSSDMPKGAENVARAAWRNAQANDPDEHNFLQSATRQSEDDWSEENFRRTPVADKIAFAKALEQETLGQDARVHNVQRATYGDAQFTLSLYSSRGMRRRFSDAHCSCAVVAVAGDDGAQEMGSEFDFAYTYGALRSGWVAQRCARDAVQRLGGTPCDSGAMPIVFENHVAAQFLQVLGGAINAMNVLKGKSLFGGRLEDKVAADGVTIVDANDEPSGMNRAPFDGEGLPATRALVVEKGVLKTYLHNTYSSAKLNQSTTANAGRASFRSPPDVSASNCYILPNNGAPEQLYDGVDRG